MNGNGNGNGQNENILETMGSWLLYPMRSPDNRWEYWLAAVAVIWVACVLWNHVVRQVLDV